MTVDEYTSLTGISVSASKRARVAAALQRAQTIVESLIGFTLDSELGTKNLYNEIGKSRTDRSWNGSAEEDLLDPDEVVNAYRLYPYNENDVVLRLDPFSAVHAVKLVSNGVTYFEFDQDDYRVQIGRGGWSKSLALVPRGLYFGRLIGRIAWLKVEGRSYQLAVDADWLWGSPANEPADYAFTDVPADLQMVITDIATFYADGSRQVKSQTVGPHSYSRDITPPEALASNLAILKQYVGPYGALSRTVTL